MQEIFNFFGGSVISIFRLGKNNTLKITKQEKRDIILADPTHSPQPKDTAYPFFLTLPCVLENKQIRVTFDSRLVTVYACVMSNQRIFYLPVLHLFLKLSMYSAAVTQYLIFVIQPFIEGARSNFYFLDPLLIGRGKEKKFQVYRQIPMLWSNIRLLV